MNATEADSRFRPTLAFDNVGFRPALHSGGLRRKREFLKKFHVICNDAVAARPSPAQVTAVSGARVAVAKPNSGKHSNITAEQMADFLEAGHREHLARNHCAMEAMIYADSLPDRVVLNEALLILRSRGFAVGVTYRNEGTSGSFSLVRRWA
jgi:hypothetical protein